MVHGVPGYRCHLDAVRADELYIITHSDTRLMVSDRVDQLLAAFDSAPRFEQA